MSFDKPIDKSESSSFEDLATATDIEDAKIAEAAYKEQLKTENKGHGDESEWQDILGSGDILKKIIKPGEDTEGYRQQMYMCCLNYEVRLRDGDQSIIERRNNIKIHVGDNEVIQGIDLILMLMHKNEVCELQIAPRFAYGKLGLTNGSSLGYVYDMKETYEGTTFGEDAWVTAIVEMLDCIEEPEHETLSESERMILGSRRRERGNWWYQRGETQLALQLYRRALDTLDESTGGITEPTASGDLDHGNQELHTILSERCRVYNNMAAAHLHLGAYAAALQAAERVLQCQPDNIKALYRKARALLELGKPEEAILATKGLTGDPGISRLVEQAKAILEKQKKTEKELAIRMLGNKSSRSKGQGKDDDADKPVNKVWVWGSLIITLIVGVASVLVYRYKIQDGSR